MPQVVRKDNMAILQMARIEDSFIWYRIRNLPSVRMASFDPSPINYEGHLKWFAKKLEDPNSILMLITQESSVVGQVRIEEQEGETVISIALMPEARGLGIGKKALKECVKFIMKTKLSKNIAAYIKPGNIASINAFEAAGLHFDRETTVNNLVALKFVR